MRKWIEILWIVSLPCHHATRLISESFERELPWHLRAAVRVHQWTCLSCRRFRRQIEFIRKALATRLREAGAVPETQAIELSEASRLRIERAVHEARREP